MNSPKLFLTAILLCGLVLSPAAHAKQGRVPLAHKGPDGWGRYQTATRPQGAANTASVLQQGGNNSAGVVQTGSGNDAAIIQFGRGNSGLITQSGSSNSACLIQSGRDLEGAIQQVGDYQTAGILQTRRGSQEIPVQVCATVTTRRELMNYQVGQSGTTTRTSRYYRSAD